MDCMYVQYMAENTAVIAKRRYTCQVLFMNKSSVVTMDEQSPQWEQSKVQIKQKREL